jgi:hypothetical protein
MKHSFLNHSNSKKLSKDKDHKELHMGRPFSRWGSQGAFLELAGKADWSVSSVTCLSERLMIEEPLCNSQSWIRILAVVSIYDGFRKNVSDAWSVVSCESTAYGHPFWVSAGWRRTPPALSIMAWTTFPLQPQDLHHIQLDLNNIAFITSRPQP